MRKKKSSKKMLFKCIFLVFLCSIVFQMCIGTVVIISKKDKFSLKNIFNYGISDLNEDSNENSYSFEIDDEDGFAYSDTLKIKINILKYSNDNNYNIVCLDNDIEQKNMAISSDYIETELELNEGKNDILVKIYNNDSLENEYSKCIYYIKPYTHQFLDELTLKGVGCQFRPTIYETNYKKSINLITKIGAQVVRCDLKWHTLQAPSGKYIYLDYYDGWINSLKEKNIKIIAPISGMGNFLGSDQQISSEEESKKFINFYNFVSDRYNGKLDYVELFNEPNNSAYFDDETINWYVKTAKKISDLRKNNVIAGVAASYMQDKPKEVSISTYFNKATNAGLTQYNIPFSYHVYDYENKKIQNASLLNKLNVISDLFLNDGGFEKKYLTEYGVSTYTTNKITEEQQAEKVVQQSTILDEKNIDMSVLYSFIDLTTNKAVRGDNFGLMGNDYTPKKAYYSMKNYYQNTNGAEYIGAISSVADGLEFHVYDKDGVPLAVCWSRDSSKTIEISYSGFTAYDLYGNEIENTDGKLSITSSPIYLKNVDRSYFYRAISNTAVSAYDEFLTNYSDYLDSSDEMIAVRNEVNKMKKYAEGLANGGEVSEAEALSKMKEHFAIGDMILKAYKDEKLSCEYVKLSSMLDQLNTIGYAFEDLVTITAKDVSNANLTATEKIMNTFDNKVSANVSVEMVYPNKIKAFAKDYYDTSSYINGLEEENPIKNGLIIGKGLHAYYLASWADSFADCYLETPEITIQYSNTELTNEDVVVTLESNVPIEMEGSNQYTFTENGSFTFKYTLYGEPKEITAVVDWIDKEAPVISGIDEREDETEQVTLNVTDDNLDTVTVTKDGQDGSFSNGDILIEKGEYEVVAKDRAGNSSERSFKIVDYIESNKTYYVSSDGTGDGSSEDLPMNVKDLNKLKLYAGDKILLKSGEKYSVNIECKRKGSPDNRVVISNYGEGALPVINGSLDLVSNLEISNLRFTNNAESCLVTNYDYCENVKIENCIFDNVADSAIYLNRQVSNFEITNCIFKNCKNAGITMKNDSQNLMVNSVKITNNIFVNLTKSIDIASEVADNTFENVEIGENYFIVQTSEEAVIKVGKIVTDKFEVSVYSNLFYSFSRAYEVFEDSLNDIKGHLLCDYNTFYAYKESKYLNDISEIKTLGDEYGNEANSNVTVIDREKYDVYDCLNTTLKLDDKEQILNNLTEKIDVGNRRMQVDVVGSPDKIIKNKVMGLEEMKTSDIEEITDSSVADEVLPLAGWQKVSIAIISIIVITGVFSAGKYSKYKKDTKKQIRRK